MWMLASLQSPTVKSTHTAVMVRHGGEDFAPFAPIVPDTLENSEVCFPHLARCCLGSLLSSVGACLLQNPMRSGARPVIVPATVSSAVVHSLGHYRPAVRLSRLSPEKARENPLLRQVSPRGQKSRRQPAANPLLVSTGAAARLPSNVPLFVRGRRKPTPARAQAGAATVLDVAAPLTRVCLRCCTCLLAPCL